VSPSGARRQVRVGWCRWSTALGAVLLVAVLSGRAVSAEAPAALPAWTNHLAGQSSPYLRMHASNPVDWYPWGAAAFAKARTEDKPVFLSIGYSTCHWCHVMAQESFVDPQVAAYLNAHFVAIKVDREELPQIDAYYCAFVAATTGSAGWPLCVFCSADRTPFFGTTYLPKAQLLKALGVVVSYWGTKRAALLAPASAAQASLSASLVPPATGADRERLNAQVLSLMTRRFDALDGGFGDAPKFPMPGLLDYLLRSEAGGPANAMALTTLRQMAAGGIDDQLGGGFHRYSVDAAWRVPHFEKMLLDQALLARTYRAAAAQAGDPALLAVSRNILTYALTTLRAPDGGFYAAQDADSPVTDAAALPGPLATAGQAQLALPAEREGAYYVWSLDQVRTSMAGLGADQDQAVALCCAVFGIHAQGNVPDELDSRGDLSGVNVLYQAQPLPQAAQLLGIDPARAQQLLERGSAALRAVRARRTPPALDAQLLTGWNGLMIGALAVAGVRDDDAALLATATATAELVYGSAWNPTTGLARVVHGDWHPAAALDYAELEDGLIALHQASGDARMVSWALELQARLDRDFWDEASGTYLDAPVSASQEVPARLRCDEDGAEPAANSLIAHNLWYLENALEDDVLARRLTRLLDSYRHLLASAPEAMPVMLEAMNRAAEPVRRVLIIGQPDDRQRAALLHASWDRYDQDLIRIIVPTDSSSLPWIAQHPALQIHVTLRYPIASYCSGTACQAPTTSPTVLAQELQSPSGPSSPASPSSP